MKKYAENARRLKLAMSEAVRFTSSNIEGFIELLEQVLEQMKGAGIYRPLFQQDNNSVSES